ncbi:hypothetical protein ASG40_18695 [Methylobacterium sp. Leaf399]|uniref:hypothetical protein n=1 Tax=unclassified Methylobacterium TaxID=2615210 RepID=UPI0006F66543|nr:MULTISPECIES: hypothetical protein [unclassified Methylobacterium]KQP59077.1 hypothetical protein ASF39_16540 [Methylobacterium sp. Leaf108]KQT15347.1 hypothetical protein ASG40_18695 [Methylobacterium sp. Leaf399]KQT78661.1 hypothetical protein ASG59_05565 [Methylobacterium sp. Leaf466]
MSSDIETHRALIAGLKAAMGKADGTFEQAVTSAFEHVFEHLERLDARGADSGPEGKDRPLKPGEPSTLR